MPIADAIDTFNAHVITRSRNGAKAQLRLPNIHDFHGAHESRAKMAQNYLINLTFQFRIDFSISRDRSNLFRTYLK